MKRTLAFTALFIVLSSCLENRTSVFGPRASGSLAQTDQQLPELPRRYVNTDAIWLTGKTIEVNEGGNFQAALDQAQPGDVIRLQAGAVFTGNFVLPNKPETNGYSPWIYIRTGAAEGTLPNTGTRVTPKHASAMPKLISPNLNPVISTAPGAHHYRFLGIEFGLAPAVSGNATIVSFGDTNQAAVDVPKYLVLDRCYVHGNPGKDVRRGVALNSEETAIVDSYISEIHEQGFDSQGIAGWNGAGPFKIVNNYIEGAAENVLFGGADPSIPNLVPSDIEFSDNHCSKPLSWRMGDPSYAGIPWLVKNVFELKNAQRVLVARNVFEYAWTMGQTGIAILFTVRNQDGKAPWSTVQDVTFISNVVQHANGGVSVLGTDNINPSQTSRRILIKNNLFEDITGAVWAMKGGEQNGGRLFQVFNGVEDLIIDHNTAFQSGNVITTDMPERPQIRFAFTGNIIPHNEFGIVGGGTDSGNATLATYFPGANLQRNIFIGGSSANYPSLNFFVTSIEEIRFVNAGARDFRLSFASPYVLGGTDGVDIGCWPPYLPGF